MKFLEKNLRLKIILTILIGAALTTSAVFMINRTILNSTRAEIFDADDIIQSEMTRPADAVMILGARVHPNGQLSDMLHDRTLTALEVYQAGQAKKILVSGDHGQVEYDEVNAIKDWLLAEGVPVADIFLDHAGFDTYDSMVRAKKIFGVNSLIISTQNFHLPRAVYLAQSQNLDAIGIIADRQQYALAGYNNRREALARVKAWLNVALNSSPKFLGDQIPISQDGQLSWD